MNQLSGKTAGSMPASNRRALAWQIPLLLVLCAVWFYPVWNAGSGIWLNHSLWNNTTKTLGVSEAWKRGLWDGRWFEGFDGGFGYPSMTYYPPLFYWTAAVVYRLLIHVRPDVG